jgi:hypothetical protein
VQVLEALDLGCVRAVTVRPGGLQDGGEALDAGVREEGAEAFAHLAAADVRVPVAVRPKWRGRVIHVQGTQPVEPDLAVDLVEQRIERRHVGHVVARRVEVARIEADPEPRMALKPLEQKR